MRTKHTEESKAPRKYQIELSAVSLFLWGAGLFVLLAWIFTLGVLAGRGLLPGGVTTLTELKNQIAKLQQMVSKKDGSELERIRKLQKDPKFAFFDELSPKTDEPVPAPRLTAKKAPPSAERREKTQAPRPRTAYVVQVASLETEDKAKNMVKQLSRKGYPVYFYKVFVKGREYYRVRCGTFKTEAEAVKTQKRLAEKERLSGFVQKVDGD